MHRKTDRKIVETKLSRLKHANVLKAPSARAETPFEGAIVISSPELVRLAFHKTESERHELCDLCKNDKHEDCHKIDAPQYHMHWCCCGYKIVIIS